MKIKIHNPYYGVPVTFLDKFCSEQFEIRGMTCRKYSPEFITKIYSDTEYKNANDLNGSACVLDNSGKLKMIYSRLIIKKK